MRKTGVESLPIFSITPFTLLDFPDKTACILWFAGCNMRCGYCYNPEIVKGKGKLGLADVLVFLKKREGLLDGVVLSGGECTLHPGIIDFAREIKALGMQIKLDTNGSRPDVLAKMISFKLLDYVALDFKSLPGSFQKITRSSFFDQFEKSLKLLLANNIPMEVRTTVHSSQINGDELAEMKDFLAARGYKGQYYLQHFVNQTKTLENMGPSKKPQLDQSIISSGPQFVWRN